MGAANCCKKPTEIVVEEIKNIDEDKPNALEQDSYPQDTELVHKEEYSQQEVSNQKLYEQEGSPQIGGAYEVPINETSPVQYNQIEGFEENNIQIGEYGIQNQQMQNEALNINQYSPDELAQFNLNNQIEINHQQIIEQTGQSVQKPSENINYEIQQSNISDYQPVGITSLVSQRSAAPTNQIQQVIKSQQISPETELNNQALNIPQATSQIKVEENNENEDLNKYFQIPSHSPNVLIKSKTSVPENINMDEIQKLIQQHQNQAQNINTTNIKSVSPISKNADNNNYSKQMTLANQYHTNALEEKANEENINKYFKNNININDIINMKDLPETFGSNNINNYIPTTNQEIKTTSKVEKVEMINPADLKKIEINVNERLPETFGSSNIQQLGLTQHPPTSVTKAIENQNLKDIPKALTTTEINKIIEMKDLPETFGSNNIKC